MSPCFGCGPIIVHLLYQGRDPIHYDLDLALALGTLSFLRALTLLSSGHVVLPPSYFVNRRWVSTSSLV